MKMIAVLFALALTTSSFAHQQMDADAVEAFELFSHPAASGCAVKAPKMVNVSIEKKTARCHGCNTYIINGSKRIGDMVSGRVQIRLTGTSVKTPFGPAQQYKCEISQKPALAVTRNAHYLSAEAVEMFQVLSHNDAAKCVGDAPSLVNIEIEKLTPRCIGCVTYVITGNKKNIDVVTGKAEIRLVGRRAPSTFGNAVKYSCAISK
jgi:hypothetical protein